VELDVIESLRKMVGRRVHWMHKIMVKKGRPERGGGVPAVRRIRRITVADVRCSGEKFRRPGGDLSRDPGGKWRGDRGILIGVARGRNGRALTRIEGGR
jgi:hypothetical protein